MIKGIKNLLAGIIAGATLGILFSPNRGKDIREKFKKEINDGGSGFDTLKSTVSEFGRDIGDSLNETYEEVKKSETYKKGKGEAEKAYRKVKKSADKAIKKAEKSIDKATKKIRKSK